MLHTVQKPLSPQPTIPGRAWPHVQAADRGAPSLLRDPTGVPRRGGVRGAVVQIRPGTIRNDRLGFEIRIRHEGLGIRKGDPNRDPIVHGKRGRAAEHGGGAIPPLDYQCPMTNLPHHAVGTS